MKCLVTGATGFAGGHLARRLAHQGHRVVALVRPGRNRQRLARDGLELFEGQLTRKADVLAAARGAEQIYHLAAAYRTARHPDGYYREVNVGGTINVLEAAQRQDCERVVYCSTIGIHGHVDDPPANEDYRPRPDDIYQETKLAGENEAQAAIRRGQPVSIVRPCAIYGEGDLRLLKLFRAIQRGQFVMIGSGRVRLHMVHVDDLVNGFLLCGSRPEALGETFLIGGPDVPMLNELAAAAAAALDASPPRYRIPVAPVYAAGWLCELLCARLGIEPPLHRRRVGFFTHHREFDISKARHVLGFEPRVTLEEGLRRTVAWYSAQGLIEPVNGVAETA